jgi:sulfatase maturation enzyme AslB (radical SAM superfamily)
MHISNFSFIVTEDCNLNCSYCYQKKKKIHMKQETVEKAVGFFYPYFKDRVHIVFYGGEPLLAFNTITHAAAALHEKNKEGGKRITYSLTTNGSLITEEMLRFFNLRRFSIMLSYDGPRRDMGRDPNSLVSAQGLIQRIREYPDIKFSTNSVFTPATVAHFSGAMRSIIESGVAEVDFSLSILEPWERDALDRLEKEMDRLTDFLVSFYKERQTVPVKYFRGGESQGEKEGARFMCSAGLDRMAIAPDEKIWGCYLFHDYLKDKEGSSDYRAYFFGRLDQFIQSHQTVYPAILENYSILRQDRFISDDRFCFLCPEVNHCRVCPVHAANASGFIGRIPPWVCSINKIKKKAKDHFLLRISY